MTRIMTVQSWSWPLVQPVLFSLLCVWQVPGTIALRFILLGLLLFLGLTLNLSQSTQVARRISLNAPIIFLLLLTAWIMVVIVFWAVDPALSWQEFRSQWLIPLGSGLVGFLLANAATEDSGYRIRGLVMTIFWALFIQVALHDLLDILYWITTSAPPFRQAPVLYIPAIISNAWQGGGFLSSFTGLHGEKFSYVNNILAAFVVAETVQRLLLRRRWLSISGSILAVASVAVLLCSYLLQYRNGNVGLLLMIVFAAFMVLVKFYQLKRVSMRKLLTLGATAMVSISMITLVLYKSDPRWKSFVDTIPVAWDTEKHIAWRGLDLEPLPQLPDGTVVDLSNYERLAWIKEGAKLVLDQPWGTGYNRNAYGDGIDSKYHMNGAKRGSHSHSGIIDFTVANGVVGVILWIGLLGSVFYMGWLLFKSGQIAPGLLLMFIISGFLSRSLVDSNIRDHMLQQFMFLVMLFAVLTKQLSNNRVSK